LILTTSLSKIGLRSHKAILFMGLNHLLRLLIALLELLALLNVWLSLCWLLGHLRRAIDMRLC